MSDTLTIPELQAEGSVSVGTGSLKTEQGVAIWILGAAAVLWALRFGFPSP